METELEGWLTDKLQALGKTKDPVKEEGAVAESIWAGHRS